MEIPVQKQQKKKIVLLGGGIGALSTAYELTNYPGWEEYYDISLYQVGWRLGGKCASGRGPHQRIEEHGIHLFLGFYYNTFRMLDRLYTERRERGISPDSPFQHWKDAFKRENAILLPEFSVSDHKWLNWLVPFPERKDQWPTDQGSFSAWEHLEKIISFMIDQVMVLVKAEIAHIGKNVSGMLPDFLKKKSNYSYEKYEELSKQNEQNKTPGAWEKFFGKINQEVGREIEVQLFKQVLQLLKRLRPYSKNSVSEKKQLTDRIIGILEKLMNAAGARWQALLKHRVKDDSQRYAMLRRTVVIIDLIFYILKGILKDVINLETGQLEYSRIDDRDFRDWLSSLGAPEHVVQSPLVHDLYNLIFAYPQGISSQNGQLSAGTALYGMLLVLLEYKGSVMWKFRSSTGETVITPLYETLKARGVKFKFFHKVKQLHYHEGQEIEKITIVKQANVKDGEYNPVFKFKGINSWPSEPFYDQLVEGEEIKQKGINLESSWSPWEGVEELVLEKGKDFDQVVLGISVAALKDICKDIIAHKPKWKQMVENVATVPTIAVQLWMSKSLKEMGRNVELMGLPPDAELITDTYQNPINSWADMSSLAVWENWPEDNQPKHISYFCGPLREEEVQPPYSDHGFPRRQQQRAKDITEQWLTDNAAFLWPHGTAAPENPLGLDLNLLVSGNKNDSPSKKFEAQYFRANVEPSDRYVLSLPGTAKYRLRSDESEYKNLFLTGDWINNGMNMGCVESTVIAGLQAAQAVRKTYGLYTPHPVYFKITELPQQEEPLKEYPEHSMTAEQEAILQKNYTEFN